VLKFYWVALEFVVTLNSFPRMCEFDLKDFVVLGLNIVVVTGSIKKITNIVSDVGITMPKSKHEFFFVFVAGCHEHQL